MKPYDVIVIGAGAAGLFCASVAGRRGRSVLVLEKNDRVGMKILISGGGRCNFTNLGAGPKNYLSHSPNFCKSALARYKPSQFMELIRKHHVPFHEKKLGQQFCDDSSRRIVSLLLSECEESHVRMKCSTVVKQISKKDMFYIETENETFTCASLVIATGGLSFPKLGSSDFGYRIAKQFGIPVTSLEPALVPFTFSGADLPFFCELSGVSLPVKIKTGTQIFDEDMLFTHRGISGPAVLQISSYWKKGEPIEINCLPGVQAAEWLASKQQERCTLATLLSTKLPSRFAKAWADKWNMSAPLAQTSIKKLREVGSTLNAWKITPSGTEGYPKAEVTLGGVNTDFLSSKTMESRDVSGLFFIGEVVDVTGHLGGYNLQWAWASGNAAGEVV